MDMIYFDHAATTRVLPEAAQAAVEAMTVAYGNPSSLYALGTQAAKAVAEHRATVAQALGCRPEELYFTSCGTEGDNWRSIWGGTRGSTSSPPPWSTPPCWSRARRWRCRGMK